MKVFWSWQSDHPRRESQHFVRRAIAAALDQVTQEMELDERPDVDHDTKGVAGLAPITDVIFEKILASAVFIADVTPVARTEAGKYVPNPNVMIELGFALRAVDWRRIILVWNTAYPGCTPEHLPFDLRHRRAPISYNLPAGASQSGLEKAHAALVPQLAEALKMSLGAHLAAESTDLPLDIVGAPTPADGRGAWVNDEIVQKVASRFHREYSVKLSPGPRQYLRIIPSSPPNFDLDELNEGKPHLPLLGRPQTLSWGPTAGGFLCFQEDMEEGGLSHISVATKYFRKSGEMWAIGPAAREYRGELLSFPSAIGASWKDVLDRGLRIILEGGGAGPFKIIAGAVGLDPTIIPSEWPSDRRRAIEDSVHLEIVLRSPEEATGFGLALWNEIRAAYGFGKQSLEQMDAEIKKTHL